jgi:hypothetical protein
MAAPNGIVFWEGPSPIDGAPIVAIATGIKKPSANVKTGPMVQTWILRADMLPTEAVKSGCDASICGNCPLRGGDDHGRACYVNVGQAPQGVYKAFQRGNYPRVSPEQAAEYFAGKQVRLGAYGDPGAVPFEVWVTVLVDADDYTGYTHLWEKLHPSYALLCMASVESVNDAKRAQYRGFRTFRVASGRERNEKPCPAGPKASPVQCFSCPVKCNGNQAAFGHQPKANIVIAPHGAGSKHHPGCSK